VQYGKLGAKTHRPTSFGSTAEIGELYDNGKRFITPNLHPLCPERFLIVMLQAIQHEPEIP
jgi:hypothetical protein